MKKNFTFLFTLLLAVAGVRAEVAADLVGKYFSAAEPATALQTDTWYLLRNQGRNAYISEEADAVKMKSTSAVAAVAETPLYEINTKDMTYFAYDENEKKEILDKIGDAKYNLQRSKGLGENQPDMMNLTTMNPTTRRLVKILPEDAALTSEMFDLLLGDNLQGRKEYISENGYLYIDDVDVS